MQKRAIARSWLIWSLAVLFLFYEFFIRVFPTAMVAELMSAFKVNAGRLGLLSAFYFYSYAPMQIPVGLLMDRFGARKLLTFASLICAIGAFAFSFSFDFSIAAVGRFLMGVGSAFGFVGMVYVCSHFFPQKKMAMLVGIGNSIGMLGAVGAEGPLSLFVGRFGWRIIVQFFGCIGLIIAFFIFLFIQREKQEDKNKQVKIATKHLISNLKTVCINRRSWLNGMIALLIYTTTGGFASLWGIPFLIQNYGMKKELAGFIVSMVFVGWIVGGPIIGILSDHIKRRKPMLILATILTLISIVPIIYIENLPVWVLFSLLFCVGFFSSGQLLSFSLAIEVNPYKAKGTSIALTNFIVAVGSSIIQPLVGIILDLNRGGLVKEGMPLYSAYNYKIALTTFPVTLVLALIALFFLKEGRHEHELSLKEEIAWE